MKRLLAIGDIHGQYALLEKLLGLVAPTTDDQLVFLGDYVDRGPETSRVISCLLALQAAFPHTVFLRGNHEQLMLDALAEWHYLDNWLPLRSQSARFNSGATDADSRLWLHNGGYDALQSYGIDQFPPVTPLAAEAIPTQHLDFLQATRFWHREREFLFVHAGMVPHLPLEAQDPYDLLWMRPAVPGENGTVLVVGHSPTRDGEASIEPGLIRLDTGAGYGRALTCCDLLHKQLWQAT